MPGSGMAVFREVEDFAAALRDEGCLNFIVTGEGHFSARLTGIALSRMQLAAGEERLSRTAFIAAPAEYVLSWFPLDDESRLISGGIELGNDDIGTLGPNGRAHLRTEGPCRWGSIRLLFRDLIGYSRLLLDRPPVITASVQRWRARATLRRLRQVHAAAVHTAEARPARLLEPEAARGLEQQLIEHLIPCLASEQREKPARRRNENLATRFEELLSRPGATQELTGLSEALGVSPAVLRACCKEQLGVSPARYLHLCRLRHGYGA